MFKIIDVFSSPMNLNVNGKTFIKTNIGAFLTLFSLIFLFLVTWFIGNDLLFKSKPSTYFQRLIKKDYPVINITRNNFPFSFGMTDDDNVFMYNSEYLEMHFLHLIYDFNVTTNQMYLDYVHEIPYRFCNKDDFPNVSEDEFIESMLKYTLPE